MPVDFAAAAARICVDGGAATQADDTIDRLGKGVVLSYGLGVDSTALLLRWLSDPESRDFDLADLLVVTSMTGDEWRRTGELVEKHVLPRLCEAGVLYAQVARRGAKQADGVAVLSQSREPRRLHIEGAYKLSDELVAAGTIPQAAGNRICSQKFKGWVIDTYLRMHAPRATRHAFGYELGEQRRAEDCARHMRGRLVFGFEKGEQLRARRATEYDTPHRVAEFPLIEWGWEREDCRAYIESVTGVEDWPKSACVYCPFALTSRAGRERTLARYDKEEPEAAVSTLLLEHRSLCLNELGSLTPRERAINLISEYRPALAERFHASLECEPHAVYEVRRIWRPKTNDPLKVANANRELRVLMHGSRRACERRVRKLGEIDSHDDIERVYRLRRGKDLPAREHFIVAGPAGAQEKALPSFQQWWSEIDQLDLFASHSLTSSV